MVLLINKLSCKIVLKSNELENCLLRFHTIIPVEEKFFLSRFLFRVTFFPGCKGKEKHWIRDRCFFHFVFLALVFDKRAR